MKYAIGCKMIQYEPKTYGKYHEDKYGDNGPVSNLDPNTEGYEVHYVDQNPPYVSWSQKEVFERFYFPIDCEDGSKLEQADIDAFFAIESAERLPDEKSTFVKGNTLTGFVQYDVSSCVDPKNYDHKTGMDVAKSRMQNKIWYAMGFVLQWARFGLKGNI